MTDLADEADKNITAEIDTELERIASEASKIPEGNPGDCDLCGEWTGRLVDGACCPCRDKHDLG